jgi:hypothetical protein
LRLWLSCSKAPGFCCNGKAPPQARISNLKRGKNKLFSLGVLIRLAARAGLRPRLKLAA